jgi:hypothetical protein
MGMTRTPEESLRSMHKPVLTVLAIVLGTFAILAIVFAVVFGTLLAAAPAFGQDTAANREAAARLQRAIDLDYSHRDRKKVDWKKRFGDFEPQLASAASANAFAAKAAELLSPAEDVHLWLKVGDTTLPTYRREQRPNFNPRVLPGIIPALKQHGKTVLVGQFADGIRYVAVATWDKREPDSMEAAIAAVGDAAAAKAPLIIDVRPNTGGDETTARRVAGMFVAQPTVYARHVIRRNGADNPVQERVLQPSDKGVFHPGPCVVLMGPANFSSCEAYLLMMRAAGARLVGEKSAGSSGNPQAKDLGNGVTAFVPSWRSMDARGQELEGVGITPDVVVLAKPEGFQRADPVLAKALEVLRSENK